VELAVKPEDLHAAAVSLASCARRLDEARESFAGAAAREIPSLGLEAVEAAATSAGRAQQAIAIIGQDIDELARALRLLAVLYDEVDRRAVGG
jgi:hypothetical protein